MAGLKSSRKNIFKKILKSTCICFETVILYYSCQR